MQCVRALQTFDVPDLGVRLLAEVVLSRGRVSFFCLKLLYHKARERAALAPSQEIKQDPFLQSGAEAQAEYQIPPFMRRTWYMPAPRCLIKGGGGCLI